MAMTIKHSLAMLAVGLVIGGCSHHEDPELAARSARLADVCRDVKLSLLDFQRRLHAREWPVGTAVEAIWGAELDNLDVGLWSCSPVGYSCGYPDFFDVYQPGFEHRLDRWIGAILAGSQCVPSAFGSDDRAGWSRTELVSDSLHHVCGTAFDALSSLKLDLYGQSHAFSQTALQEAWTQAIRPLLEVALPICTPDPENCPRPPDRIDGPGFRHQLEVWQSAVLDEASCGSARPLRTP